MAKQLRKTGERVVPAQWTSQQEYITYLRHLFAYAFAMQTLLTHDSTVLDVGCGEGYGTSLLSEHVKRVTGLDVDEDTVAHAAARYGTHNCSFRVYDGTTIPYESGAFDAVVSFQVIEHVHDDLSFVCEVRRVLKQNGLFVLTTPNRTHRVKPGHRPWNRFHVREYYPDDLERLLATRFSHVRIWGIRAVDEIQEAEMERVRRNQLVESLDPFNLRKLIPEPLRLIVSAILKRLLSPANKRKQRLECFPRYSVDDFCVTQDDVQESLDLLAICEKRHANMLLPCASGQ